VRYHVENYFHELYIFQNRTEAFFKLLRRSYGKQPDSSKLNEQCDLLEKALKDGFAGVMKARGGHVHESRFDDVGLRHFEAIEFLARLEKRTAREYSQWFQDIRMEKAFWMRANDTEITKWLDECGRVLGKLLFIEDGAFRFPSAISNRQSASPTIGTRPSTRRFGRV
jgi:hypothetical protein